MNDRIRYIRKNMLNLSMEEFGEIIGISKSAVSQIEAGTNRPSDRTVKLICSKFNVNEDWLRNGNEPMLKDLQDFGEICAEIAANDEKAMKCIIKYYELSDDDKKLVWKYMEVLAKMLKDGGD